MTDRQRRGSLCRAYLRRWMDSLVMECDDEDGGRIIVGLDPGWYGIHPMIVIDHVDPTIARRDGGNAVSSH